MMSMDFLVKWWETVSARSEHPDLRVILAAILLAAALVVIPQCWRVMRHAVTITHEGAHAVVAQLAGRKLQGIQLHSDTSGVTVSRGRATGLGMVFTLLAGYIGPALTGLGVALLVGAGYSTGALWLLLILLVLMLLRIRNWFGLLPVLVTGVAIFAVIWWAPDEAQVACTYFIAWFLLMAAPRPVFELQSSRRRGKAKDSDADQLARITRIPGLFWVGVFLVVTLGALAIGGYALMAGLGLDVSAMEIPGLS